MRRQDMLVVVTACALGLAGLWLADSASVAKRGREVFGAGWVLQPPQSCSEASGAWNWNCRVVPPKPGTQCEICDWDYTHAPPRAIGGEQSTSPLGCGMLHWGQCVFDPGIGFWRCVPDPALPEIRPCIVAWSPEPESSG